MNEANVVYKNMYEAEKEAREQMEEHYNFMENEFLDYMEVKQAENTLLGAALAFSMALSIILGGLLYFL